MAQAFLPNANAIPSYYAYAATADNGCAQAAVAVLVDYWQRVGLYPTARRGTSQLVDAIYRQHPPDTPGAWFGSTPWRVANIFKALGFATVRRWGETDSFVDLVRSVEIGCPQVVLVDLGKLGDAWALHHYLVVVGVDDKYVYVRNMLDGQTRLPRNAFMEAWHCWALPSSEMHYAAIAAAPTLARLPRRSAVHASSARPSAAALAAALKPDDPAMIKRAAEASTRLADQTGQAQTPKRPAVRSASVRASAALKADDPAEIEKTDEAGAPLALQPDEGREGEGATADVEGGTRRGGKRGGKKRVAKATPVAAQGPKASEGLRQALDEAKRDAASVRIDGEEITSLPDAAARLAKLDAEVLDQLEQKLNDGLRESRHRRAIWENPLTRPGKDGPELPVHYVADVDTRVGWVDEDWQACGSADCPENVRHAQPKTGKKARD